VVFVPKYRRTVWKGGVDKYLKSKLREVSEYYPDLKILEANTDEDHVHLLVSMPPRMAVSQAVRIIKANTGRALRRKFPVLQKLSWGVPGIGRWGILSRPLELMNSVIRKYIEQQGREDSGQAKLAF